MGEGVEPISTIPDFVGVGVEKPPCNPTVNGVGQEGNRWCAVENGKDLEVPGGETEIEEEKTP